MSLTERVALVAGGALSVGRGYARALASAGMHVVVADQYAEDAQAAVELIQREGGSARFVELDVTDEQSTQASVSFAVETFGRLDVLVNNLATYRTAALRPMTEITLAQWDRTIDVCVRGVWLMTKAAVPFLAQASDPAIINSTTVAAYGVSHWLDYGAARGAVIAMTKSMAVELAPQRIRVNTICVGAMGMEAITLGVVDTEAQMISAMDLTRQLIPRLGTEDDVTSAVQYLADTGSSYMTGQTIVLDGGKQFLG